MTTQPKVSTSNAAENGLNKSNEHEEPADEDQNYQSRLLAHCELGQYDEIAELLRKRRGLFINCVDSNGNTPLHVVRDVKCAELLLENGAGQSALNRQNRDGETPLLASLRQANAELAAFLLDNGADIRPPNKHFQHCLHVAAHSGLADLLDRLLDMRQLDPNQPDRRGNSALHYAVAFADHEIADKMLARLLREPQVSADAEDSLGRTAFTLAAQSNNLTACRQLRDRGCDLCHADSNGADALHVSAATASPEVVHYLVADLSFSVDRCDKLGRSPLFYAVHHAREDNAEQLLALGAEPNRPDRCGRTAIHVAAEKGLDALLNVLLNNGGDASISDMRGQTPLHLAAVNGRYSTVKRLLQWRRDFGANAASDFVESTDLDDKTARQLALDNRHQQVANLLGTSGSGGKSYPRPQSAKQKEAQQQRNRQAADAADVEKRKQADETQKEEEEEKQKLLQQQREVEEREAQEKHEREKIDKEIVERNRSEAPSDVSKDNETEKDSKEQAAKGKEEDRKTVNEEKPKADEEPNQPRSRSSSRNSKRSSSSSSSASSVGRLDNDLGSATDGNERSDKDDPYLTAKPSWINGEEVDDGASAGKRQQKSPLKHQSRRLRRSQKEPANIAALRRRLYMYDSTVMLGRSLNEERRERMYLRGGATTGEPEGLPPAKPHQHRRRRQQHRERPSTAAEADRLTERYRDINRDTRQLLEEWRQLSCNDGGGSAGGSPSRPVSGRSASGGYPRPKPQQHQQQQPQPHQPYRRPQSGSRFLDYFPNNTSGKNNQNKQQQQRPSTAAAVDADKVGRRRGHRLPRSRSRRRGHWD